MLQATSLASGTVGPVMMGWIFDIQGEYDLAIKIFIGSTALAMPLAFMVRPPLGYDTEVAEKARV